MGQIDLDSETIQYDGAWFTRDDLARRIKAMLDAGDYNVAKPSQALEQLTTTLTGLRTLAIRVTPDMADALNQAASRQGKTAAGVVREALSMHLGISEVPVVPASGAGKPVGMSSRHKTDPEMPVVPVVHSHPIDGAGAGRPQVLAGPGALRSAVAPTVMVDKSSIVTEDASPEEAARAVDLTPKKKEDESIEKRWFGG
jgi:hypothetical protein